MKRKLTVKINDKKQICSDMKMSVEEKRERLLALGFEIEEIEKVIANDERERIKLEQDNLRFEEMRKRVMDCGHQLPTLSEVAERLQNGWGSTK